MDDWRRAQLDKSLADLDKWLSEQGSVERKMSMDDALRFGVVMRVRPKYLCGHRSPDTHAHQCRLEPGHSNGTCFAVTSPSTAISWKTPEEGS